MNSFNWWTKRCCGRIELSNQSNHNLTTSFLFVVDIVAAVAILINLWTLSSPSVNSTRVWHAKNSVLGSIPKISTLTSVISTSASLLITISKKWDHSQMKIDVLRNDYFQWKCKIISPRLLSFSRWFTIEGNIQVCVVSAQVPCWLDYILQLLANCAIWIQDCINMYLWIQTTVVQLHIVGKIPAISHLLTLKLGWKLEEKIFES